jgi:D-lactate dehydrogenase (cytochrome)
MAAINQSGVSSKRWRERSTLFLKFSGTQVSVKDHISKAKDVARENECELFEVSEGKDEIEISWSARKALGPALISKKKHPTDLFLTTDTAVPISRLADAIEEMRQAIGEAGVVGSTLGHVGDGE